MKISGVFSAVLIFLVLCTAPSGAGVKAASYKNVFKPYYGPGGTVLIAIRSFTLGDKEKVLAVDPYTFGTSIADASEASASREVPFALLGKTPFMKALEKYSSPDGKTQNSGITHADCAGGGLFLTVDMCPSKNEFDRELFTATESVNPGSPVPVALAVSGLWIKKHEEDFNWIVGEKKAGRLAVTWINHTYSHPYTPGKPNTENFLLTPGVDFEWEVLGAESVLIEHGEVPSPFFRFPGLVSNDGLVSRLKALSLIPVGTDAWTAKGEEPKDCSIILVHGNGNEPGGIKKLLGFYEKNSDAFSKGTLKLLPLEDAFGK